MNVSKFPQLLLSNSEWVDELLTLAEHPEDTYTDREIKMSRALMDVEIATTEGGYVLTARQLDNRPVETVIYAPSGEYPYGAHSCTHTYCNNGRTDCPHQLRLINELIERKLLIRVSLPEEARTKE